MVPSPGDCKKYFIFSAATPSLIPPNPGGDGGIYNFIYNRFLPFYAVLDISPYSTGGTPTLQQFSETQATLVGNAPPCPYSVPTTGYSTINTNTSINNNTKELFTQLYPTSSPAKSKGIYWAAAPKVGTGSTAYNYVFMFDGSSLYTFKVDASGVNYISSSEFLVPGASNNSIFRSELEVVKLSSGNYQLGFTFEGSSPVNIATVEFNTSGLPISSTFASKIVGGSATPTAHIRGLEFTPDGSKLVFTNTTNSNITTRVNYIASPYTSSTVTAVTSIPANTDLSKSQIEIRYTGSTPYMYFATTNVLMSLNVSSSTPSSWVWNSSAVTAPSGYSFGPTSTSTPGMGNPQQETFLLPDQMDGVDYSAYQNEGSACCYFYSNINIKEPITLPVGTYTVTNNTPLNCTNTITGAVVPVTFTSTTISTGNITIPVGSKYTFQNLTIKFAPNTGMIVNAIASGQGGKVVLNATTLTWYTDCGESQLWNGVVLNGSNTSNQGTITNSPHAVLTTIGISQIDHALTAINIKGGAIVQYTGGSKLLDNKVAIEAEMYTYPPVQANDVSVFSNAIIKTQSTFNIVQPNYFANLVDRKQTFRFLNCTFENAQSSYNNLYDAIISNNSTTYLSGTTVKRVKYGVYHTNVNANGGRKLTVAGSTTFTGNLTGVYVGNSNFASIQNSFFNLLDNTSTITYPVGLYVENSSKFIISNNYFKNENLVTAAVQGGGTIGIVANNVNIVAGEKINIIKGNTFEKLHEGIQCVNKNYFDGVSTSPRNLQGLRFYCNSFLNNIPWCDIGVHSGAVDYNQGISDSAAANVFSHTNGTYDLYHYTPNLINGSYEFKSAYFYDPLGANHNPTIPPTPSPYPFTKFSVPTNLNTCGAGGVEGQRVMTPQFNPNAYLEKIALLENQLSFVGGSTSKVISDSTALNEDSINVANNIAKWKGQLDELETQLVIYYLNDTITPSASDSALKYILLFTEGTTRKGQLVDAYLAKGELKSASNIYEQIVSEESGSNYQKIYGVIMSLYGKDIANELLTNSSILNEVQSIANDHADQEAYLIAQNLLGMVQLRTHVEEIQGFNSSSIERRLNDIDITSIFKLSNFPNPFTGSTILTAFVPKGINNACIVITDVLGKEVAKYSLTEGNNAIQFDKQDAKGILYYSLVIDGLRKETKMMMKH
ncbi:MAG: hypothetical protein IPG89_00820 [Bacteroidetes bacterium]|nr:hypothetical protein [Bacteroidota bacterium]